MERRVVKVNIIVWSVVGVVALVFLITLLTGGWNTSNGFDREDSASIKLIKEMTLDQDVTDVTLEWRIGRAQILKSEDNKILIRQNASWTVPEEKQVTAETFGGKLVIEDQNRGGYINFFGLFGPRRTYLEIYLPEKLYDSITLKNYSGKTIAESLQAKRLDVNNFSGETSVRGDFQEVQADNSSGSLNLESLSPAVLSAHNLSGDSRLKGLFTQANLENSSGKTTLDSTQACPVISVNHSGDIVLTGSYTNARLENTSGETNLRGGSGALEVRCKSGNVRTEGAFSAVNVRVTSGGTTVHSTATPETVDADVTSGNIRIAIPENSSFTQSLTKASGSFSSDFSAGEPGSGENAQYRFHITSGGIRLEKTSF